MGDRWPDPLDDGCEPGGEDWGGVPRVPELGSPSKNVSRSWVVEMEYRLSIDSSRTSRETFGGRLPRVFCIDGFRGRVDFTLDCDETGDC